MNECTFAPKTNYYEVHGKVMLSDLDQQLMNSKVRRLKMEAKYANHDLEEQTFMPQICEKSRKMVQNDG